jgi:hypothetical protein
MSSCNAHTDHHFGCKYELVGYLSPAQLPQIKDVDDEAGNYLPMRKTPAGNFTLAVYAAPVAQQAAPCPGCAKDQP